MLYPLDENGPCKHRGNENGHANHNKSHSLPIRIICVRVPLMNEFTGIFQIRYEPYSGH
jgi:hypothetical protein